MVGHHRLSVASSCLPCDPFLEKMGWPTVDHMLLWCYGSGIAIFVVVDSFHPNEADGWLAQDKWLHFIACFGITLVAFIVMVRYFSEKRALLVGSSASLFIGIAKEIYDIPGASYRDFVADLCGILLAIVSLKILFRKEEYQPIQVDIV